MTKSVLDTCAAIKILENPNFFSMLCCRLDLKNSTIILCSQMIFEFHKNGFDLDVLVKTLESNQINIDFKTCTKEIHQTAVYLESLCDSLHCGDSDILAIAYENKFELISCDKGLVNAAKQFNVKNVNPDIIPSNGDTRRLKIPYLATVKKVIQEKKNNEEEKIKTNEKKISESKKRQEKFKKLSGIKEWFEKFFRTNYISNWKEGQNSLEFN